MKSLQWFYVLRWLRPSGASVDRSRTLVFVGFTAVFTWFKVEPRLGGLPLTIVGPPPPFRPPAYFSSGGLTLGFPLVFWNGFTSEPQFGSIAANVAIGLCAWTGLYLGFRQRLSPLTLSLRLRCPQQKRTTHCVS